MLAILNVSGVVMLLLSHLSPPWAVCVRVETFHPVLDLGGDYCCASASWNVHNILDSNLPLLLFPWVKDSYCCRAIGSPKFYYTMYYGRDGLEPEKGLATQGSYRYRTCI